VLPVEELSGVGVGVGAEEDGDDSVASAEAVGEDGS
jgi:hypothetical protein